MQNPPQGWTIRTKIMLTEPLVKRFDGVGTPLSCSTSQCHRQVFITAAIGLSLPTVRNVEIPCIGFPFFLEPEFKLYDVTCFGCLIIYQRNTQKRWMLRLEAGFSLARLVLFEMPMAGPTNRSWSLLQFFHDRLSQCMSKGCSIATQNLGFAARMDMKGEYPLVN